MRISLHIGSFFLSVSLLLLLMGLSTPVAESAEPACDRACQERRALLGDGLVARKLAEASLKTDRAAMMFWYQVAAENGDADGQYNFAHFLSHDSRGGKDCFRAIFWFGEAAKQGHKASKERRENLMQGLRSGDRYDRGCLHQMTK